MTHLYFGPFRFVFARRWPGKRRFYVGAKPWDITGWWFGVA